MEYIFIADFFVEDFRGGAEFVNEEVIKLLQQSGSQVEKIHCHEVTESYVNQNSHKRFIVSNFMRLGVAAKNAIYNVDYILYEHDHKYLVNRNPAEYPNMKAPPQFIVDADLYQNANAVFCQSAIHKEVLDLNIPNINSVNLGSSLWTKEFLSDIEEISAAPSNGKAAVIMDANPIKQQGLATSWCEENKIPHELVSAPTPVELAKKLASYEYLVFFPQVLETFSRVVVEAKMVGCKIYTNQLLGAASEGWFKSDRQAIIDEMRKAPEKTYREIQKAFETKKERKKKDEITVILNAYRRPYNLEGQIAAIRQQSIQPTCIWLWINDHEDNREFDFSTLDVDRTFKNDHNWKFYGRFAAALLSDTKYVAIFDDDTVPGSLWLENCLNTMSTHRGILGSAGVILHDPQYYMKHQRCGWPTQNQETTQVDLVGHAWFFEREWLQYLWKEKPFTWDNGEDIQFSYLAQKYGGIQTYCPPHPPRNKEFHGSILGNELGIDDKATSNNNETSHQQFFHERDLCVQNAIKNGWKTVNRLTTDGQQQNESAEGRKVGGIIKVPLNSPPSEQGKYKVKFINHACICFENEDEIILMDPWFKGRVFNKSWSLLKETPEDLVNLKKVKHVLISHEHPDHLHWGTLKKIISHSPDAIVHINPKNKMVEKELTSLGFTVHKTTPDSINHINENFLYIPMVMANSLDSAWLLFVDGKLHFNQNDCDPDAAALKDLKNNFPAGLPIEYWWCQFSIAGYYANEGDDENIKKLGPEARKKLFRDHYDVLKPKKAIPFASYVYFCKEANEFLNQWHVPLRELVNENPDIDFLVPYFGEDITTADTSKNIDRWEKLFNKKKPLFEDEFIEDEKIVSYCNPWLQEWDHLRMQPEFLKGLMNGQNREIYRSLVNKTVPLSVLKINILGEQKSFFVDFIEKRCGFSESDDNACVVLPRSDLGYLFQLPWGADTVNISSCSRVLNIAEWKFFIAYKDAFYAMQKQELEREDKK